MRLLYSKLLSKVMTQIHCFKVTQAAEPNTENTEVLKRSMNRVVKETPALTTGLKEGHSIMGEWRP